MNNPQFQPPAQSSQPIKIRHLGLCSYQPIWQQMKTFTQTRGSSTPDEIWLLQHHPVFTQGTSCHTVPAPADHEIPVLHTDRGGQITYHGPGQLIAYLLLDLKRRQQGVKSLVQQLEQVIIDLLQEHSISASRRCGAPGVYVQHAKIAALGLRIHRGCCFHGLSLNVDMDTAPYQRIDPCGYQDIEITQLRDHVAAPVELNQVEAELAQQLRAQFG